MVIRRTQYDLRKAQERAHILAGLIIASDNIDEVIRIIRAANTPNAAIAGLIERFNLSEIQARAIVCLLYTSQLADYFVTTCVFT